MSGARPRKLLAFLLVLSLLPFSACQRPARFGSDFEQDAELDHFPWECRTLFRLSPEHATSGSTSLEITFFPAPEGEREHYPGIAFSGFDPNWSSHRAIGFDAYNPEDKPLLLTLRVDDRKSPAYSDRFNEPLSLPPGQSRILIPLANLVTTGSRRTLNPHSIQAVMIFLVNPTERQTLFLDRLRLE